MKAKLVKGSEGGLAVEVPQDIAREHNLQAGQTVDVEVEDGRIKLRLHSTGETLQHLLDRMTPENQSENFDDPPRGRERL